MSLLFTLEALRFHKLKSERFIQLIFLITMGLNAAIAFFPLGDTDFSRLIEFVQEYPRFFTGGNSIFDPRKFVLSEMLTPGNYLFLASNLVLLVLNAYASVCYAVIYYGEKQGNSLKASLLSLWHSLPKMLLLALYLIVPVFLSALFFFIPLPFLLLQIYFVPLIFADGKYRFTSGIERSRVLTNGIKMTIFLSWLGIQLLTTLGRSIGEMIIPSGEVGRILVASFITTIGVLMKGRLMGAYYMAFSRRLGPLSVEQVEDIRDLMRNEWSRDKHSDDDEKK